MLMSLILWGVYSLNSKIYQHVLFFSFFFFFFFKFSGESLLLWFVGLDKVSFLLAQLTSWLVVILFFCILKYNYSGLSSKLNFVLFVLSFALVLSFLFLDWLGFYIFFELSLVPLVFIILGWGYQVERISASFYLFVYTLLGSFPLLFIFIVLKSSKFSLLWYFFPNAFQEFNMFYLFFCLVIFFSLMIKLPMYLLHLWLPKAHVEAPGVGSMVLAAVLLKLSAYAFYRLLFLSVYFIFMKNLMIYFLLLGSLFSSVLCLLQTDLKALIAYSSISHMGFMMGGLFSQNLLSFIGFMVIILGHGFCSSALFFLANVQYEQNLSRQLFLVRGQGHYAYFIAFFWILFLFINFSVPPFMNVVGELVIFMVLLALDWKFFFVAGPLVLIVASYCVYCFSVITHGTSAFFKVMAGEKEFHYIILLWHLFPLFFIVLGLPLLL